MKLLLLLLGTAISLSLAAEGEYSYSDQAAWGGVCTTGERQSPIDVNSVKNTVSYISHIASFGGSQAVKKNTVGLKTVQFDLTDTPTIVMPDTWPVGHTKGLQALQLHFHWGESGAGGSEHKLFGKHYKGEAHLVTRNLDQEDAEADDYLAVFGVFLQTGVIAQADTISESIGELANGLSTNIDLDDLYKPQTKSIFTYRGGLTTPGCNEIVFWQVLEEPITLTVDDMNAIRGAVPYDENFREIQELNGRDITHRLLDQHYDSHQDYYSGSSRSQLPFLALVFVTLFYLM